MAYDRLLQLSEQLYAPARYQQAIQHEALPLLARDGEGIGLARLPIQQPDDRPSAVGRPYLEAFLAFDEFDMERLDIHPAIVDLDHGMERFLLSPEVERFGKGI